MASLKQLLEQRPPRQILVIRTDRVGDLILSTPFLAGLREHFPQAAVTALVDPYCREVLQNAGLVDHIVTELPAARPDLAIALAPRTESLQLARRSKAPLRLGYVYKNRPLVRLAAKIHLSHCEVVAIDPPRLVPHEVEQLDRLARRLGMPSTLRLPLTVGLSATRTPGKLVFHLGDRWLAGGWTFEHLRELLRGLRAYGEITVTAGPREEKLVAQHGLDLQGVELRAGNSFSDWAALVGAADLVVSPDTGAVHLAAAMATPVVVAYEASTYEHCSRQWAPWKVPSRSVVKGSPAETIPKLLGAVEELVSNSRNGAS